MMLQRLGLLAAVALTLGACASPQITAPDTATRNMPIELPALSATAQAAARDYVLADLRMVVPGDLRISESNSWYPFVDVVWRGDPVGDRRAQIAALFQDAAARNIATPAEGQRPVIADVTLRRFHGVTERTRYTVGGVYSIRFELTIRDAETGVILEPARLIEADLPAPGGQAAVELERAGQTERVRVTDHLTWVLRQQLGLGGPF